MCVHYQLTLKVKYLPSFIKSHICQLYLMYACDCYFTLCIYKYINIQRTINHTPADKTSSHNTRKYKHYIIQELSTHGEQSLEYFKRRGPRPSTSNVGQSRLRTPWAVPASGGVTTVTALSGLIRVRGCWSRHPGRLSSPLSFSLTHFCSSILCWWGAESYYTIDEHLLSTNERLRGVKWVWV